MLGTMVPTYDLSTGEVGSSGSCGWLAREPSRTCELWANKKPYLKTKKQPTKETDKVDSTQGMSFLCAHTSIYVYTYVYTNENINTHHPEHTECLSSFVLRKPYRRM